MTSRDRVSLDSILGQIRQRVPFDIGGDLESGELTVTNFPQVTEEQEWVLQIIFEETYKFCERNAIPVRAIRLKDATGHLVSEVVIA